MVDGETPLYSACQEGHRKVVELLVRHEGLGVNQACDTGATPLIASSCEGHRRIVNLLLDAGANAAARFNGDFVL